MGILCSSCYPPKCIRIVIVGDPIKSSEFYSFITKRDNTHEYNYHYEERVRILGKEVSLVFPLTAKIVWKDQITASDGFIYMSESDTTSYFKDFEVKTRMEELSAKPKIIMVKDVVKNEEVDKMSRISTYVEEQVVDKEMLKWLFEEIKKISAR